MPGGERYERSVERGVMELMRLAKADKDFEKQAKAVGLAIKWASVKNRIPPTGYGEGFEEEDTEDGSA